MGTSIRVTPLTWFTILALIAIGLALGLPPDPETLKELHTSQTAYRLAIAAVLIPYIFIWYTSFYTYSKLQDYSRTLKDTKDGVAFQKIALGMGVLAFSLVIPTIISLILNNIAVHNPGFKPTAVIISNYLGLFPGLLAFLLLYNGSRKLVWTLKGKVRHIDLRWHAPWFFLLGITFSHLTLENQYQNNSYHLSPWILIVSYIIPFIYAWMVGLLSAYDFRTYAKTVKGLLYRRGIRQFASGISVVIIGSVTIQFVNISIAQRLNNSLGTILLIDYLLLILISVGLILMAVGTKKLKKIEDI